MYIYIDVMDREISEPKTFNNKLDAQKAMRKDFIKAIGDDTVTELKNQSINVTDINVTIEDNYDFGINENTAWVNDAFGGNHADWDGKIFEI